MKLRSLDEVREEVEACRDKLGTPIDPKIKDLVIGLKRWGITTKGSCEGRKHRGYPYPWVEVPAKEAVRLAKLVAWQNRPKLPDGQKNTNNWVLRPGAGIRLVPENKERSLEEMQKDAVGFGLFLQNLPESWAK